MTHWSWGCYSSSLRTPQQKDVCVDSRISIAQNNAQHPHLNVWRVVAETILFLAAVVCDEADEQ